MFNPPQILPISGLIGRLCNFDPQNKQTDISSSQGPLITFVNFSHQLIKFQTINFQIKRGFHFPGRLLKVHLFRKKIKNGVKEANWSLICLCDLPMRLCKTVVRPMVWLGFFVLLLNPLHDVLVPKEMS